MIEPYEQLRLVRSKNFIHLEGDEESKRKLYKDLLAEETQGNFLIQMISIAKIGLNQCILIITINGIYVWAYGTIWYI